MAVVVGEMQVGRTFQTLLRVWWGSRRYDNGNRCVCESNEFIRPPFFLLMPTDRKRTPAWTCTRWRT